MTRFLAHSLEAHEPFFSHGIKRLEAANGHPNTDIRFSTEVNRSAANKLRELGLDPHDTTAEELYHHLQQKIALDDKRLTQTLQTRAAMYVNANGDVVEGMIHAIKGLPDSKRCFALKQSVLKTLIKRQPPKKAMKKLGYRSSESMLKHESPVSLLAAAWLTEGKHWQEHLVEQYKKLQPSDFENRSICIIKLDFKRWPTLAQDIVADHKHNVLAFKELGALIFLPLPKNVPSGAVTASLSLGLHQLNEIRATSTFLKLCQVRGDFGNIVKSVAVDQPKLTAQLLDQPVPWHLVQQYYSKLSHLFSESVFEPHVQLEDMVWHPIEEALSAIEPSMKFWHNSGHLGVLDGKKPVSLNVLDSALNYCNDMPYDQRINQYFQESLWHELLLRYLQRDSIEDSVARELQPKLATELAMA